MQASRPLCREPVMTRQRSRRTSSGSPRLAGLAVGAFLALAPVASPAFAWGTGGGGGGDPTTTVPGAPPSNASTTAPKAGTSDASVLSQLAQARRLAQQVKAQTAALKTAVSRGATDARIRAVSTASPAIEANLKSLIRIGNALLAR